MNIQDKLHLLLADRGISQSELARRSGYAQSQVNLWINGKGRMYADQAYRICTALSVSADWLLDEEGNEALPMSASTPEPIDKYRFMIEEMVNALGPERAWKRLIGLEQQPLGNVYTVDTDPEPDAEGPAKRQGRGA